MAARVILCLGTSHSPVINTPLAFYPLYAARDEQNRSLWSTDLRYCTYDELRALAGDRYESEVTEARWQQQHQRCQTAIEQLAHLLRAAAPDVVLILATDKGELFPLEAMPALAIYWGDAVRNIPRYALSPPDPSFAAAAWAYGDAGDIPVHSGLAQHLIERLTDQQFDVAQRRSSTDDQGLGHAFGFVVKRIMEAQAIPIVPVVLNTRFGPNALTARRCFAIGEAISEALAEWEGSERVAVVASGGLSHFVVAEDWDRALLRAAETKDKAALTALPEARFHDGTAESKVWITAAGVCQSLDLRLHVIDYVKLYRTAAGTGGGWNFGAWT